LGNTQQPDRINVIIQLADALTSLLHLESKAFARIEAQQKSKA
jgi:hypothetical protein